jgi:hypothetical protein
MFLFHHGEQQAKNASFHKGKLFERLMERYLSATGFDVEFRQKHNSLEYDLEGKHTVDKRHVIGEAKAHDRTISGEVFSGFVGKLLPLGLIEHQISALFLSTSPLTSDADDYFRKVSARYTGITVLTGEKLAADIRRALALPEPDVLGKHLKTLELTPLTTHLLTTEHGVFVVVLAATQASAAPAAFAVYREDGTLLQDSPFLSRLASAVPELQDLRAVTSSAPEAFAARYIGAGLAVGTTWDDYRLPAAPDLFVGRRTLALDTLAHVRDSRQPSVLQIKSRSGVGKSSFLAFAEASYREHGFETELHDARDVKSVFDLLSVVQRFSHAPLPAGDIEGAVTQLRRKSAQMLANKRAVFMVDQFEATFTNPELFYAYEALLAAFLGRDNMFIVIARKNDLLTTYDETQISLQRLNSASRSLELRDFEVGEAVELIDRISAAQGKPIAGDVKAFVLEFAQGFPWLIKRTMAHILRLVKQGAAQSELFAAGLRLDELFDEELEGLDELERDYLTRIASRLPADFSRLQREFDEDPLLPRLLDKLTGSRLLRMSGATYDTYNDVFKEYLLYRRLPEYRPAFIHRISPKGVFRLFHRLVDQRAWTFDELRLQAGATRGTAFNLVRELRNVGLLKKDGELWTVPHVVLDVYNRGNLSEYVRRHMMDNAVISDLLERLNKQAGLPKSTLSAYLRERFPFIQATEHTWETYATITLSWLRALRLVDVREGILEIPKQTRAEVIESLGNLTDIGRQRVGARRSVRTVFLPGSHWSAVERSATGVLSGDRSFTKEEQKGLQNLRGLGLLDELHGPKFIDVTDLRRQVGDLLRRAPYTQAWSRIESGDEIESLVRSWEGDEIAESTIRWRAKLLAHWGRELGLVDRRRRKRWTSQLPLPSG